MISKLVMVNSIAQPVDMARLSGIKHGIEDKEIESLPLTLIF